MVELDGVAFWVRIRDASDQLDAGLATASFEDARIHVLFGFPRSDIGKAELTARLGVVLGDGCTIIKIDGFLNTNVDGRHPSRVRNDFVVYRKFHERMPFGGHHLLLGAEVILDFLNHFGECQEHLSFRPHLAKFFALKLHERWVALGKPRDLLVEVGGTFTDYEVRSFIVPAFALLRRLNLSVVFMLLTEAGFSGEGVKARPIVVGLAEGKRCGLVFDVVFARLPANFPSYCGRGELETYLEKKIQDSMVSADAVPRVLCIPYFHGELLEGYLQYLHERKLQIFGQVNLW